MQVGLLVSYEASVVSVSPKAGPGATSFPPQSRVYGFQKTIQGLGQHAELYNGETGRDF